MSSPRVTAIVVSYRSRATIGVALASLREAHRCGLLRCVVVDNASDDGTVELVRREHGWVQVVESDANLGFGRGNNLGLRDADTEYVLFLNPDASLELPDLQRLIDFLDRHPQAGIAGPALDNGAGEPQLLHSFPTPWETICEAFGRFDASAAPSLAPGTATRRVDWLCGAALLARRKLLEELGGFDPRFFLYFEETDLCLRAAQHGSEVWVVGDAVARHLPHASARGTSRPLYHGCIAEHYFRSRFYYYCKHHGWLQAVTAELIEYAMAALRALLRRLRGSVPGSLAVRLHAPLLRTPARD